MGDRRRVARRGVTATRNDAAVPWDLKSLDPPVRAEAWADLVGFVDGLREDDVEIPSCWYVHGWVVERLLALAHWRGDAFGEGSSAREAADWWSSGLAPLIRDCEPLHGHHGVHPPRESPWADPEPTPSIEEVMARSIGPGSGEDGPDER